MAFDAKVLQVLIASPSDVAQERDLIPKVIYDWNAVNSEHEKIVLLPVKWETHSSPQYRGDDTQEILNEQFVRNSDILIGAMWTKLGTPTLKTESGTVEEIEEFIHSNKPIKLYFSKQSLPSDVNINELQRLRTFKETYQSQGIYGEYSSIDELRHLLSRDLTREVHKYKAQTLSEEKKIVEHPILSIDASDEKKN